MSCRKPHSTSNHLTQEDEVMKHTTGMLGGGGIKNFARKKIKKFLNSLEKTPFNRQTPRKGRGGEKTNKRGGGGGGDTTF